MRRKDLKLARQVERALTEPKPVSVHYMPNAGYTACGLNMRTNVTRTVAPDLVTCQNCLRPANSKMWAPR